MAQITSIEEAKSFLETEKGIQSASNGVICKSETEAEMVYYWYEHQSISNKWANFDVFYIVKSHYENGNFDYYVVKSQSNGMYGILKYGYGEIETFDNPTDLIMRLNDNFEDFDEDFDDLYNFIEMQDIYDEKIKWSPQKWIDEFKNN